MLIYFACLATVTASALVARDPRTYPIRFKFFVGVAFAAMVLAAGFRGRTVGTDTNQYVYDFTYFRPLRALWADSSLEPGWLLLQFVAGKISHDYWALLTVIALLAVFFYMRSVFEVSVDPAVSLFVFITMGYYTFFFNGARQGIACAIYTMAFAPLLNSNLKKYAFWVMIAFLFHRSVIIALPLYFLFRQTSTIRYVVQMILGATVAIWFFDSFLDLGTLVSGKYIFYQQAQAVGGRLLTVLYVCLSAFFLFCRRYVGDENRHAYDYFLNMFIFGSTIYVVVTLAGGYVELVRLGLYFHISLIFLWPILLRNVQATKIGRLFLPVFLIAHVAYFYLFVNRFGDLVPYQFNEDVVRMFGY